MYKKASTYCCEATGEYSLERLNARVTGEERTKRIDRKTLASIVSPNEAYERAYTAVNFVASCLLSTCAKQQAVRSIDRQSGKHSGSRPSVRSLSLALPDRAPLLTKLDAGIVTRSAVPKDWLLSENRTIHERADHHRSMSHDFSILGYSPEDFTEDNKLIDLFESWMSKHG
ncbi:hypothetical protein RIF29_45468 [Crotalaria pallida]|uniref:Uncharacterized protein n=1 Tax=Crotalaria pallida TaxID=3830 RepID=A0AAN9HJD5_CROPI